MDRDVRFAPRTREYDDVPSPISTVCLRQAGSCIGEGWFENSATPAAGPSRRLSAQIFE